MHLCQEVWNQITGLNRLFKPSYDTKALIHTWLAWQEEPGTPLRLAVTRKYLRGDHPRALEFAAWLRRLFRVPTAS